MSIVKKAPGIIAREVNEQIFLRVIAMRAPEAFLSFKYLYYTLLFTTPYLVFSTALSQ